MTLLAQQLALYVQGVPMYGQLGEGKYSAGEDYFHFRHFHEVLFVPY